MSPVTLLGHSYLLNSEGEPQIHKCVLDSKVLSEDADSIQ